jgi:hypothetical protein
MRVRMPVDSTMPNPQDPTNAPYSSNSGGTGFMPYRRAWARLPDAIKFLMAAGRPKEVAQTDLCRAIADRDVKIRGKLGRLEIRGFRASDTVLQGTNFQIPPELKPEDLDWEGSCPWKPWMVPRGSFSPPGPWYLEWIEIYMADVTNVLCRAGKQDESTAATSTSQRVVESEEMPDGSGPRSSAGRKPGAAEPARRRGPRPKQFERARDAMRNDIQQGRRTPVELEHMLEKNLVTNYGGVSRTTARKARNAVLSELNSRQIPTNDK